MIEGYRKDIMDSKDRVRILIVDDKPDKAMALASVVSELGDVVCVHSGKDALRCLLGQSFAVILLDVNMPIMDGFETAELIRKRELSERTPIIFVTSYYDAEAHKIRAYNLGAVDYILAPIIPEFLKAKVAVFVDLYRKTEEVKHRADERVQLMREQMARVSAEAARAAAEDGERRAAFLSNASHLLSSSLDYEATLERVAQLTVPQLCDWCTVNIVKEDGQLQCLAIARADIGALAPSRAIYTSLLADPLDPVNRAIQSGVSELIGNVAEAAPDCKAMIEKHLQAMNLPDVLSFMIVPLQARDRTFGALTFKTILSRRQLTPRDLVLAEDLAGRAAIAIDNARLYKEAQTANRMKDEFLTVVSHELRTPLTPIVGWTRMLRSDTLSVVDRARALEVIERNAKAQAKLIEDLLDVGRIITGKFRLSISQVDVAGLVANSIDSLRPAADAKRIAVDLNLSTENLTLPGDAQRLQQVFWNLLSNAIKFTPAGGRIGVRAFKDAGHIAVEVTDTGKGIDPAFLPFVFERFRQADSTTTRTFGGLGIGLAIVRHLMELHGGTVQADSNGDGKGATFTVRFPLLDTSKKTVAESSPTPLELLEAVHVTDMRLQGTQVLIVDDEPDTRDLLTRFLEQHGAVVSVAASAHEAMEHLERENPQVMISDIGMPGEDGFALIRKIRNTMGRHSTIPAIALTAYARDEDAQAARAAGFHAHMSKPIDFDALILLLEKVVHGVAPAKNIEIAQTGII